MQQLHKHHVTLSELNEITGLLHAMALDKKKLQTIEPNPGPDQPKHPGSDEQQANKTPKSKAHR
jgi:hypothetical protein